NNKIVLITHIKLRFICYSNWNLNCSRFTVNPNFTTGGIASLADISLLLPLKKKGLYGIIVGKALYENKFTLPEALRAARRRKGA
ncbi:MAG: hypothetical protein PHC33_04790, partial [Candidatus Omnitrophica bacterium]|nr:hypothetical protein [Candidatus Omnitrophota bacterium]